MRVSWVKFLGIALVVSLAFNAFVYTKLRLVAGGDGQRLISDVGSPGVSVSDRLEAHGSDAGLVPEWAQLSADLNFLFQGGEMTMAFTGLAAAQQHYPKQVQALVYDWFNSTRDALVQSPSPQILQKTEAILEAADRRYFNHWLYQWLRAEQLNATGEVSASIDVFIELQRSVDQNAQYQLQKRLSQILKNFFDRIFQERRWLDGLAVADRVLWHVPDDGNTLLLKASLLTKLQRYGEAEQTLGLVSTISEFKGRANEALDEIALLKLRESSIPLESDGNRQFLVNARVAPNADSRDYSAKLLLDTGATLSVLTKDFFEQIANPNTVELIRVTQVNTAGGQVDAPIYRFARLQVGDYALTDIEVAVMDYPSRESVGLLGMNFLGRFKFDIDQQNKLLVLSANR